MNFQVVTCADKPPREPYATWREFNASLARYGIEPVVLGWGRPWLGLGSKPKLLKRAIEDGTITAPIILFCDAFDVLFADDPRIIAETFGGEIVWNAEKSCFPDATLAERHPPCETPFRYLNSGMAIGRTSAFAAALDEMKADDIPEDCQNPNGSWMHVNDQGLWMLQFLNGSVPMRLDSKCEWFQTMFNVTADELDFSGERIRNRLTGTYPMAFHLNGPAKTQGLRERLLASLGL